MFGSIFESICEMQDLIPRGTIQGVFNYIEEALLMAAGYCKHADSSIEKPLLEDRRIVRQLID